MSPDQSWRVPLLSAVPPPCTTPLDPTCRYDAGDNVKFNLPMAWSAGVLAWSLVDFEAGYKAAGEYKTALDNVKWATDYFIKCIGDGKTDIVVQVGNVWQHLWTPKRVCLSVNRA
jgi:hypothetical protein